MRTRLPLVLSATALAVAVLGSTGPALAHGVKHALFAHNADKVDGKHAVSYGSAKRKGKLVATSATSGRLPNDIIAKAPDANELDGLDSTRFRRTTAVSGETLTGSLGANFASGDAGLLFLTGVYPARLPTGSPTPTLEWRPPSEPDSTTCPGPGQASPGYLCVYGYNTNNLSGSQLSYSGGSTDLPQRLYGFTVEFLILNGAQGGYLLASWAYRVP